MMLNRSTHDGAPIFQVHHCTDDRRGQVMTTEELHDFAVQVLMEEYADIGSQVTPIQKKSRNQADFSFHPTGKRNKRLASQFTGRKEWDTINVMVVCRNTPSTDISDIDTSWLVQAYRQTGAIPRITLAYVYCTNKECNNGMPALCGGDFHFKFYSVSPLPDQTNAPLKQHLTDVELAARYAESWNKRDASLLAPFLDKDFHYGSRWVFDELPSRMEFLPYYESKLAWLQEKKEHSRAVVGRNHQTGQVALIIGDSKSYLTLELTTRDGRLTSAFMNEYDSHYREITPADELYQMHGNHLDSIMPADELINGHLQDIISQSEAWRTCHTTVTTEEQYERVAKVASMLYGHGPLQLLTLAAFPCYAKEGEFLSMYPMGKGVPVEVTIDQVMEWDNQAEATVMCHKGDFDFAFFATDYYCNRSRYQAGHTLTIDLAAIAMHMEQGQQGFEFTGQQAIDWLAKIGQAPTYDERGEVEPVRFNMSLLVAYLNHNPKCPDEAEFQSPIGKVETTSLMHIDFCRTDITVSRSDDGAEDGDGLKVPLYFRKDFLPEAKEGDAVMGNLWMTGCVNGAHDAPNADTYEASPADLAAEFALFMERTSFDTFEDLMPVLARLPLLHIRQGYELDAFAQGDRYGWSFRPYCKQAGAPVDYDPEKHGAYTDSFNIDGMVSYEVAKGVPDALDYFKVPFTPQGIMQAWLMSHVADFMPRGWHANYGLNHYVFDKEAIDRLFPLYVDEDSVGLQQGLTYQRLKVRPEALKFDREALLPTIRLHGDFATLKLTYWNDWNGLVQEQTEVVRFGDSVVFKVPTTQVLLPYACSLRF